MTLDVKAFLLHIDNIFGQMSYPGDGHIVYDNSGVHLECKEIKEALKGRHWRNVSFETLEKLNTALPFLSQEGYRFYLPAFMVFSVSDFYRADIIPYEVISSLTRPITSDMERIRQMVMLQPEMQHVSEDEWEQIFKIMAETYQSGSLEDNFFSRVSGFSLPQCKIIRQFLEYMRDVFEEEFPNQEPQIAIDRYWYMF